MTPNNFPILGWYKRQFISIGDIWIKDQRFNDLDNPNRLDQQNLQVQERNKKRNYSRLEILELRIMLGMLLMVAGLRLSQLL